MYIDPNRRVDRALITHAHSDHARPGSKNYLATPLTKVIMDHRFSKSHPIQAIEFGKTITINGVKISFHPAGHIIGSAQIRLEYKGEVWVASGDYKIEHDGLSEEFEPLTCQHFITESTFAMPIYNWEPQQLVQDQINNWWNKNASNGVVSVLNAYSLGKAQRIVSLLDASIGPILVNRAIHNINEQFCTSGIDIPRCQLLDQRVDQDIDDRSIVISSSSTVAQNWSNKEIQYTTASASGWMATRANRKNRLVDKGFILSDHADWAGLLEAIKWTGAQHIYVAHGFTKVFAKYLNEAGWNAHVVDSKHRADEEL